MPQRHDIGQQKRRRPAEVSTQPNGNALALRLVERGLASPGILELHTNRTTTRISNEGTTP